MLFFYVCLVECSGRVIRRVVNSGVWPFSYGPSIVFCFIIGTFDVRLKPGFTSSFRRDSVRFASEFLVQTLLALGG